MQDRREEEENPEKRGEECLDFCDKLVNNLPTNLSINNYLPVFDNYNDENNFDFYDLYDELNN